jgi:hypothetical protein
MPTFWELLKKPQQAELQDWYQRQYKKAFRPPGRELHIEPASEIPRLMTETGKEIKP